MFAKNSFYVFVQYSYIVGEMSGDEDALHKAAGLFEALLHGEEVIEVQMVSLAFHRTGGTLGDDAVQVNAPFPVSPLLPAPGLPFFRSRAYSFRAYGSETL